VKDIVLLSGGVDSLVALAQAVAAGSEVACVSVDYGQRHSKELGAGERIALHYGVPREVLALHPDILSGSALTGRGAVPRGLHYADPAQAATVVPNRNMVLASLAAAVAVRRGASRVLLGAHAGDAAVYPDCRPEFVAALSAATVLACGVSVEAPLLRLTKADVVRTGRSLGAPLAMAWTCYIGGPVPCGGCGACVELAEAEGLS